MTVRHVSTRYMHALARTMPRSQQGAANARSIASKVGTLFFSSFPKHQRILLKGANTRGGSDVDADGAQDLNFGGVVVGAEQTVAVVRRQRLQELREVGLKPDADGRWILNGYLFKKHEDTEQS